MAIATQPTRHRRTFFGTLWFWLFRLLGWNAAYHDPGTQKYVVIVWPHTSNWDFFIGFIFSRAFPMPFPHFLAKDSLFRGVLGWILRRLGGVPVDRSKPTRFVEQVADEFRRSDKYIIAITPEGTRTKTPYWRSGFYHIAQAAQVPIVLAAIDYEHKFISYGATLLPTGNLEADMEFIRHHYAGVKGRHPERQGSIQMR